MVSVAEPLKKVDKYYKLIYLRSIIFNFSFLILNLTERSEETYGMGNRNEKFSKRY